MMTISMTRTTTTTTRSSGLLAPALVLLLAALALLPALGETRETASHEGLYGVLAQEVAAGRGFFAPRLGGRAYAEKPPAFFWAAALAGKARGQVDLVAARLPSALALAASALLVLALGRRLGGERQGLVAAVALLAMPLAVHAGRVARLDASLTALILLAAFLAVAGRDSARARSQGLSGLAGLALGLAVLVKGPIAIGVFVLFGLAIPGTLRRWPALLAGLAIPLTLYVLGVLREAPGQLSLLLGQHDLTSGADEHDRAFSYYLAILPAGLGAMLPFALLAGVDAVKTARERGLRVALARDPGLAVAAGTFVLLSAIPGKRAHYLVPVYPFVALSVGALCARAPLKLWGRAAPFAIALVGLGVTGYVGLAGGAWSAILLVASVALLVAGVAARRWTDEKRLVLALAASVCATGLGIAAYQDRGVELLFPENGAVKLGAVLRGFPEDVPLALADADPEAIFFADRPFDDVRGPHASEEMVAWGTRHAGGILLLEAARLADLPASWGILEIARGSVRKHDLVLVRRLR
jgi:4-amino-4-deoxy-L-arabinose transferase-like glycosyltransferase